MSSTPDGFLSNLDGILLFNKPILWTSHDAVDFIRRRLGQRSVGHAGTLDPLATGLLVILVGKATKLSNRLMCLDKDYAGTMTLGVATDTHDLEGRILSGAGGEHPRISRNDLLERFRAMLGAQEQMPPSYSSVKTQGEKMYALARRGVAAQVPARPIVISDFRLLDFLWPEVYFFISCSKGTYVRSICDALGKQLGCGAVLSSLVRSRVGPFALHKSLDEESVRRLSAEALRSHLHENLLRVGR